MTGVRDGELESAAAMVAALQGGTVTAVELVERAIARAEAWQPSSNAFSQLWGAEAVELARRIDAEPPAQRSGPMAGVPIAVKDLFDVSGHETTGCCAAYRGTIARHDAPVIERIRRAGLVMIGKTNQHELAAGGTNLPSACGRTGNPWDPERMTGGSSGGSAAAVAAGIVPWALGSDTGGSIRIPASLCGTYGLKPTTGRLPLDGLMPLSPSMDCPGTIAQTVVDLWDVHRVIAGLPEIAARGEEGYGIGVLDGFFEEVVHEEVMGAVRTAADLLEGYGVRVERRAGRGIEDARVVWMNVCTPEFAEAHPLLKDPERRRLLSPQVLDWIERGERISPEERATAARRRDEIRRWYLARLEGLDALLIPTTPYSAPRVEEQTVDLGRGRSVDVANVGPGFITCSVNLAGLPAVTVPGGRSSSGMPIGVSLVGRQDGEETLLGLATLWEHVSGYRPKRPSLPAA
jgi:aspartyl-tRNA(Asn)/glutamyl-tRNA(Gln) amidotransferase subunit A